MSPKDQDAPGDFLHANFVAKSRSEEHIWLSDIIMLGMKQPLILNSAPATTNSGMEDLSGEFLEHMTTRRG